MDVNEANRRSVGVLQRCRVALICIVAVSACAPLPHAETGVRSGETTTSTLSELAVFSAQPVASTDPYLSLVGDPDFDEGDLNGDMRRWYDRLRRAVDASLADQVALVARDDVYEVARSAYLFNHALLVGLRSTGDLRFLDAADDVAQAMRNVLRDEWCGRVSNRVDVNVRYGTVREPDGFVNFRLRRDDGDIHYCRDTGDLNETLAHGHIALLMYAYHVNRDNPSPSGIDYGERADFWLDYLRNHFEAKWRERTNVSAPDMDFIALKFCHTYHQMLLYYTYVGLRLHDDGDDGGDAYLRQSMRLTDGMFSVAYVEGQRPGGFIDVDTPLGEAVVYSFGAPGAEDAADTHLEACPVTYARYMHASILNLRLDGVPGWDDDTMQRLATGLAHFVVDTDPLDGRTDPFAAGVSGEGRVAMLPPTEYRQRVSVQRFADTPFAALSAWDGSRTLERVLLEVYETVEASVDEPASVHIPAGKLLASRLDAMGR